MIRGAEPGEVGFGFDSLQPLVEGSGAGLAEDAARQASEFILQLVWFQQAAVLVPLEPPSVRQRHGHRAACPAVTALAAVAPPAGSEIRRTLRVSARMAGSASALSS